MKSTTTFFIFAVSLTFSAFTQTTDTLEKDPEIKRNTIYLEGLGQGLYNSLSFDRLLHLDNQVRHSVTGGFSYFRLNYMEEIAVLGSYNLIFGQNKHHLELGIGFTAMSMNQFDIYVTQGVSNSNGSGYSESFIGTQHSVYTYFTPKIGYRYQKPGGGFFYRLTCTPAVAGINYIGPLQGGTYTFGGYYEIFSSASFFGPRIFPWFGMSFGYTLKNGL